MQSIDKLTIVLHTSDGPQTITVDTRGGVLMQTVTTPAVHAWAETVKEYLTWGRAFGGKHGRPWDIQHGKNIESQLTKVWKGFKNIEDVTAAAVESELASMPEDAAPATRRRRYESIRGFLNWCLKRDYLAKDPMKACTKPHGDPVETYRALTLHEFKRLLAVAPPYRKLLYEVAADTGLRADELRTLVVGNLDVKKCGLRVKPENDKTRREQFILLSPEICAQLEALTKGRDDHAPLMKITANQTRELDKDLKRAGIPKAAPEGKVVFHSLRATAITWAEEHGATDAQSMAFGRHATSSVSKRYRKTRQDDLRAIKAKIRNDLQGVTVAVTSIPESPSSSPAQDVRFSALPPLENILSDCAQMLSRYLRAPAQTQKIIRNLLEMP